MVYSEVPNFSEPNPELLSQTNQQNKSVSSSAADPSPDLTLRFEAMGTSQYTVQIAGSVPVPELTDVIFFQRCDDVCSLYW